MRIILERHADCWVASFYGIMPEDVELPLPFSSLAYLQTVAADMRNRFPGAYLFYRDSLGRVSRVALI